MNFPRFWAKGESGGFSCWRWSDRSLEEAQGLADEAAKELSRRFGRGELPSRHWGYYPDRPFREQILEEVRGEQGEVEAVVTRNSYGCRVLNTAKVMFVDIDLETEEPGLFERWFGKSKDQVELHALDKIKGWSVSNPQWGWRIYRTRAGLRLLATQGVIEADSLMADGVFEALGADPLYWRLCKTQKCYRARLTPKPWRCGIRQRPARWPWLSAKEVDDFQKWEARYQGRAGKWATCELVDQIGSSRVDPRVKRMVDLHDAATGVGTGLELA